MSTAANASGCGDDSVHVKVAGKDALRELYGTKDPRGGDWHSSECPDGLGRNGHADHRDLITAMAAEMEPDDAVEAMLVSQMTATHAAMMLTSGRFMDADTVQVSESYNLTMNRLARTFATQVET